MYWLFSQAGELVNTDPKSLFTQRLADKKESSLYLSKQKAPLGRSHDQSPGLPKGMDKYQATFGIQNVFGEDCYYYQCFKWTDLILCSVRAGQFLFSKDSRKEMSVCPWTFSKGTKVKGMEEIAFKDPLHKHKGYTFLQWTQLFFNNCKSFDGILSSF